jgi:tetratricopeptide (TPR) repeat protein
MGHEGVWQRADAAFDRLLDLPAGQRADALATMRLDPEVDAAVRRLLAAHDASAGVLDRGPLDAANASDGALAGKRLGRWRLEHEIGRGGMSVVYRARTDDDSPQVAAVKLLTLGALADRGLERFQYEQSVLARLRHAHIATLFEAGVAEDGTPWLAMALVDGVRIDAWCEHKQLYVREIVTLFLGVCDAVSYAHRNLVIHRDLKPSNVLVDQDGHVRLLDFGIARLADDQHDATATQSRALTPGYAAPEQFGGAPPSTAMDVYGLGALLYRLLAGKPPREAGADASTAPTAPSRTPHGARSARVIRGDLDAVVMKALSTDPARRHESAAALAQDLVAWLEHRPVSARSPGIGYRTARFVARHRVAVAAIAAVLVAVVVGLAAALWQAERAAVAARHAKVEAERARAEAQRATAIKEFLLSLFEATDPERPAGAALDSRGMLKLGTARLRDRSDIAADERIDVLTTIATAQRTMGWLDDAESSLTQATRQAGSATLNPLQRANLYQELALFERAREQPQAALPHFERAEQALANDQSAAADELRIRLHTQRGIALSWLGRQQDALAQFGLAEKALVRTPPALVPAFARINLLSAIASTYYASGRHAEALEHWRATLALQRVPGNAGNASIALTLSHLAGASAQLGLLDEAVLYDGEAVVIARASYPADHPNIADALYAYGDTMRQAGRYDESLATLAEASAMRARSGAEASRSLVDLARVRTMIAAGAMRDALTLAATLRAPLATHYGAASAAIVQLTTQEVIAHQLDTSSHGDAAVFARADALLAALDDEMRWHPLARMLRCRLAQALHRQQYPPVRARQLLAEVASLPPDAVPNATATVICGAVRLEVFADEAPEDSRTTIAALMPLLDRDLSVSTEAQGAGRIAVALAARRIGDEATADTAIASLAAYHAKRPVPAEFSRHLAGSRRD